MDVDSFSLLKYGFIVGLATYVFYRIIRAIVDFRAYAKIFNDCPGETDFHWLLGTLHKYPGPNEAGLQYDFEAMMKWPHFYRVWLGPLNPMLYIYHPDLIRIIIKSSAPKPRGRIFVTAYDMALGWLGEGLLVSNGSKWARNRRLLTPAFHFDILRSYVTVKNQAGDVLLDKMLKIAKENKSFEAFELVSPCLLDILLQCAFSHNSNCQTIGSGGPYLQAVNELLSLWTDRFFFPLHHIDWIYKLSANGRKWNKLCKYVHAVSDGLIAKRRTFLEQNKAQLQKNQDKNHMMSFVDILLTAVDEDGKGMTPLEIRNEADTFLFEGKGHSLHPCLEDQGCKVY